MEANPDFSFFVFWMYKNCRAYTAEVSLAHKGVIVTPANWHSIPAHSDPEALAKCYADKLHKTMEEILADIKKRGLYRADITLVLKTIRGTKSVDMGMPYVEV